MDLVRSYSKRPDLLHDLVTAVRTIKEAQAASSAHDRRSVQSDPPGESRRLVDRLSEDDARQLARDFRAGTPKWMLAERYGLSRSSVKRLLRKYRDEG